MFGKHHIRMIQRSLLFLFVSQREGHCDKRAFGFYILNSQQSGFLNPKKKVERNETGKVMNDRRPGQIVVVIITM